MSHTDTRKTVQQIEWRSYRAAPYRYIAECWATYTDGTRSGVFVDEGASNDEAERKAEARCRAALNAVT